MNLFSKYNVANGSIFEGHELTIYDMAALKFPVPKVKSLGKGKEISSKLSTMLKMRKQTSKDNYVELLRINPFFKALAKLLTKLEDSNLISLNSVSLMIEQVQRPMST